MMQEEGQILLNQHGFQQYEVSAYSKNNATCQHNLNYWKFGDYLAIGAGAHAKITNMQTHEILRMHHFKHPKQYMDVQKGFVEEKKFISTEDKVFEFFLNVLRLKEGVPTSTFSERTGLSLESVAPKLELAVKKGWLEPFSQKLCATPIGYRFLNDLTGIFLTES
jgi:coproporphyrinogen III oxidase-like Fe-S oxidoreductase